MGTSSSSSTENAETHKSFFKVCAIDLSSPNTPDHFGLPGRFPVPGIFETRFIISLEASSVVPYNLCWPVSNPLSWFIVLASFAWKFSFLKGAVLF